MPPNRNGNYSVTGVSFNLVGLDISDYVPQKRNDTTNKFICVCMLVCEYVCLCVFFYLGAVIFTNQLFIFQNIDDLLYNRMSPSPYTSHI